MTATDVTKQVARVAALAAATVTLTAPSTAAEVSELSIAQGPSNGYGASCSYTVTATVTPGQPVEFSDSSPANFTPATRITPTGDAATVNWIPSARGEHLLSARQGNSVKSTPVIVGTGISTGSTSCQVIP